MTYWRMQVHPEDSKYAVAHTVDSLSAGYIGLDFIKSVPDLRTTSQEKLPIKQRPYWAFAHEMKTGDRVLIFTHHYPFALVRVAGDYNYIRKIAPELGVWFRHFRKVNDVRYYADFNTNPKSWKPLPMTATITPLRDTSTSSYRLIEEWLRAK